MGNALRVLNAGAEHTIAQSQVDAARLTQKAHNDSQLSLAESKRIIQTANNAASDVYAASQTRIQAANNAAASAQAAGQTAIRDAGNVANKGVADAQRQQQAEYNQQAILINEAQKTLQSARNERAAQDSSTTLFVQSLKNQRMLDEAGTKVGQIAQDVSASLDRANNGKIMDRIAASQMLGASVAQAAAAGVGGSSVDMLRDSLQMQQALKEGSEDEAVSRYAINAYKERGQVMNSAVNSLDYTPVVADMDHSVLIADQNYNYISDNQDYTPVFNNQDYSPIIAQHDYSVFTPDLDYTQYIDHKKMSGLMQVATFIGAGVATYFGGPQAGNAVMDASMSVQDMRNGNFNQAYQEMGSAFKGAVGGFDTYRAGASGTSSGQAWGSQIMSSPKPASGASTKY